MSAAGAYLGGATRIYLSADGTIWSDDPKNPRPKSAGRWAGDTVGILGPDDVKPINIVKVAKHRYIAGLAHLYRSGKPINELPLPPRELWPSIRHQYGNSIIGWINQDEKIRVLFWTYVAKQDEAARNPEKKPLLISRKKKKKGGASAGARRAYFSGGRLFAFA